MYFFYKAYKSLFFYIILAVFLCSECYSAQVNVYGSGGFSFSKLHNESIVNITDMITNEYQPDKKESWDGFGGGAAGIFSENVFNHPFAVFAGIGGYYFSYGRNIQGTEFPLINDGLYDTLDYSFTANSASALFESRLFYTGNTLFEPFVLGGIGIAWNRLYNYQETPTNPTLTAAPVPQGFGNHTQNAFAWEAGAGVLHQFGKQNKQANFGVSLDYRYFDNGKGHLSSFPADTAGNGLKINNLYTQCLVFSLIAFFH